MKTASSIKVLAGVAEKGAGERYRVGTVTMDLCRDGFLIDRKAFDYVAYLNTSSLSGVAIFATFLGATLPRVSACGVQ
jgi:hypothetical protein